MAWTRAWHDNYRCIMDTEWELCPLLYHLVLKSVLICTCTLCFFLCVFFRFIKEWNMYRVLHSMHASYSELCSFVKYLQPRTILPCVIPSTLGDTSLTDLHSRHSIICMYMYMSLMSSVAFRRPIPYNCSTVAPSHLLVLLVVLYTVTVVL